MISILNYGIGNLASIRNMFRKVGVTGKLITTPMEIDEAMALVIPGVGNFDNAIRQIDSMGLRESLEGAAHGRRIPILGICLGMQLMTRGSDEGKLPGLGWVNAYSNLIDGAHQGQRVPHMGWNTVTIRKPNPYFDEDLGEHRFYFVHSYAVHCDCSTDILTTTYYAEEFVSAFEVDNLLGVQFHPEKSHKFGASFFRHYAKKYGLLTPQ